MSVPPAASSAAASVDPQGSGLPELERLDEGQGTPVVLLHSGGMSNRQWKRLASRLLPGHRVVAPDFLGTGKNPPWPSDQRFEYGMDVTAVLTLLRGLGAPAHVVGHSYGGFIALKVAQRAPELVSSLSLYDPVAFGVLQAAHDQEGLTDLARAGDNPIFRDPRVGGTEPWFAAFVDYWNGDGAWSALPEPARQGFLAVGRKVFMEVDSLIGDPTPASAYAKITAHTLFMVGERSPAAARRLSAILSEAMPSATLVSLAGQGHMGPISAAEAVNELIAEHIAAAEG
jgi:pimeloyl-ACP methyl ester carboxylesterase